MKITSPKLPVIVLSVILLIPFFYFVFVYFQSYDLLRRAEGYRPALATRIFDTNGVLISELYDENRNYVDLVKIPEHVRNAFLAAEDQSFYTHTGIDMPGIIRALMVDIFSGEIKQGGSTITQQLVKQLYTGSEKSLRRKIIELLLAYKFEKRLSKDKIFEMYLNQIYFGHGVYGVAAAARFYFNVDIEQVTVVQAAILAGIPSAPNRFSPIKNPRASYERSKQVLHNMFTAGFADRDKVAGEFGKFWQTYADEISSRYETLSVRNIASDRAPHFTEYVRQWLITKYGKEKVYRGGLKVYTTLDLRCQDIAQGLIKEATDRQNKIAIQANRNLLKNVDSAFMREMIKGYKIPPVQRNDYIQFLLSLTDTSVDEIMMTSLIFGQAGMDGLLQAYIDRFERLRQQATVEGAFVALNPKDGAIVAMVGGSEFNSINQLNRAVLAKRQPGSSFKPFVFAAAIESKLMTAATAFLDAPIVFKGRRKMWEPSNYDNSFYGTVLARKALAYSLNIVSILVYELVGGDRIARLAARLMQIPKSRFEIDPTMSLGTSELTPLEMATGFAVFANQGKAVHPYSIRYITDQDDKKIFNGQKNVTGEQLISKQAAFVMTSLLQEVCDRGTATNAIRNIAGFTRPAAGKTGTNTKFRDAWFVGYTNDLCAAVWLGCDSQNYILGSGQSAAVVAAPVWGKFMKEVYTFMKYTAFPRPPADITQKRICSKTGLAPLSGCPSRMEYFIKGTEPKESCDGHHSEMLSVFDMVKKSKMKLIEKMNKEINSDGENMEPEKKEQEE